MNTGPFINELNKYNIMGSVIIKVGTELYTPIKVHADEDWECLTSPDGDMSQPQVVIEVVKLEQEF